MIDSIYLQIKPPRLIYSIDHGHFFPNSPNWTANDLAIAQNAQLDPIFVSECNLQPSEIEQALEALVNINEAAIIDAVAYPPTKWGITIDERTMMVEYLIKRQSQLLALRQVTC